MLMVDVMQPVAQARARRWAVRLVVPPEPPLRARDVPWLGGIVLFAGIRSRSVVAHRCPESHPPAATVRFLGYGVSLVFFVLGLRHLGTARTDDYFSTALFVGAALLMGIGVLSALGGNPRP